MVASGAPGRLRASMNRSMADTVTKRLLPMQMLSSFTPLQPFKHQRHSVDTLGFATPVSLPMYEAASGRLKGRSSVNCRRSIM